MASSISGNIRIGNIKIMEVGIEVCNYKNFSLVYLSKLVAQPYDISTSWEQLDGWGEFPRG